MPEWLIPILSILGAAVGAWIGVHSRVVRVETRVDRLESEIGTHESGLRGAVHKTANRVTEIDMRLNALERRRQDER
jgi:hypothetical protein